MINKKELLIRIIDLETVSMHYEEEIDKLRKKVYDLEEMLNKPAKKTRAKKVINKG